MCRGASVPRTWQGGQFPVKGTTRARALGWEDACHRRMDQWTHGCAVPGPVLGTGEATPDE